MFGVSLLTLVSFPPFARYGSHSRSLFFWCLSVCPYCGALGCPLLDGLPGHSDLALLLLSYCSLCSLVTLLLRRGVTHSCTDASKVRTNAPPFLRRPNQKAVLSVCWVGAAGQSEKSVALTRAVRRGDSAARSLLKTRKVQRGPRIPSQRHFSSLLSTVFDSRGFLVENSEKLLLC